jgi:hypothetical protein
MACEAGATALAAAVTVDLALLRLSGLPPRRRLLAFLGLSLITGLPWFGATSCRIPMPAS